MAAPRDFPRASPSENPSEQPCQPSENPVHPSSFTWINPLSNLVVIQGCRKIGTFKHYSQKILPQPAPTLLLKRSSAEDRFNSSILKGSTHYRKITFTFALWYDENESHSFRISGPRLLKKSRHPHLKAHHVPLTSPTPMTDNLKVCPAGWKFENMPVGWKLKTSW